VLSLDQYYLSIYLSIYILYTSSAALNRPSYPLLCSSTPLAGQYAYTDIYILISISISVYLLRDYRYLYISIYIYILCTSSATLNRPSYPLLCSSNPLASSARPAARSLSATELDAAAADAAPSNACATCQQTSPTTVESRMNTATIRYYTEPLSPIP